MALQARYATTCARCGQAITPGSAIASVAGGTGRTAWAHQACAGETGYPGSTGDTLFGEPRLARTTGTAMRPGGPVPETPLVPDGAPPALEVWTDGACSGNPGPGGWAWATRDGRRGSGGEARTTNQRMEIRAALEAVRTLDGPLVVISDSTYVVNCFRDRWWEGWLARNWMNSQKKPVANRDLWEPLVDAVRSRGGISFRWVRGHSGDEMNDLVDSLAVQASRAAAE